MYLVLYNMLNEQKCQIIVHSLPVILRKSLTWILRYLTNEDSISIFASIILITQMC